MEDKTRQDETLARQRTRVKATGSDTSATPLLTTSERTRERNRVATRRPRTKAHICWKVAGDVNDLRRGDAVCVCDRRGRFGVTQPQSIIDFAFAAGGATTDHHGFCVYGRRGPFGVTQTPANAKRLLCSSHPSEPRLPPTQSSEPQGCGVSGSSSPPCLQLKPRSASGHK